MTNSCLLLKASTRLNIGNGKEWKELTHTQKKRYETSGVFFGKERKKKNEHKTSVHNVNSENLVPKIYVMLNEWYAINGSKELINLPQK